MKKPRKTTKKLTLLVLITLIFTTTVILTLNQPPLTQNTLTTPIQQNNTTTQNPKIGTSLQKLLQTSDPASQCEMIIFFKETINHTQGINLLKSLGDFEIISNYTILNGVCIKAPIKMAETIAQQSYIQSISHNGKIKLADHHITTKEIQTKDTNVNYAIGATTLQNLYNLNGTGVVVAVLDTGINPHIYLDGSRIVYNESFVPGENYTDLNGHGTAVAGIIGASSSDDAKGVAPNVTFLNLKVLDKTGEGKEDWLISAINEALSTGNVTHPHPKADIISLSLGSTEGSSNDAMCNAVNEAWENGVIVVAAAGNEGGTIWSTYYETINSPGLAAKIITVGSAGGFGYTSISSFSSRGPTDDKRAKPDIVAPGENLITLSNDGIRIRSFSGTSASTPVVSGAIALLLDNNSNVSWVSPNTVKAALMVTAKDLGLNPFSQGAGLINISRAYEYLNDYYINGANSTPPLIITPIRAISEPMTINEVYPTILNLTIVVGNITQKSIINAIFNVSGNASIFTTVPSTLYSLNDTQIFVEISFLAPPGVPISEFVGNLTFVNSSGTGDVLFVIPLSIPRTVPLWVYLLPTFYGRSQTENLLAVGSIFGVAAITIIGLVAIAWAKRRKPEAPPTPEYFGIDWDLGLPPRPPEGF
ncbi:MAG: S8 family serine peptidase [Candidatus Freyarchaeota archaeon]|nr:S8 family serine peptidase [Candidatus Jordarchaeia archaeon]MBS7269076.1 S8 family serine peptidase [Candidatus Jordarchaeia archaeon]